MKRRLLILPLLLVLLLAVASCSGDKQSAAQSGANEEGGDTWEWPAMLVSVDTNVSAPTYVLAISWTPLHEQDAGVKWRVLAEASSVQKTEMLSRGQADFWWSDLHTTAQVIEGNNEFATKHGGGVPLVVGHQGFIQMSALATLADSGIESFYDVGPGTRYSIPAGTTAIQQFYNGIAAWLDLEDNEFIRVPFSDFPGASNALAEQKVDVTYNDPGSIFARKIESGPHGLRFLSFPDPEEDPEGYARYRELVPTVGLEENHHGIESSHGVNMMKIRFQGITTRDADPEMVYRVTKWLDENFDRYKDKNWNCPMMNRRLYLEMVDMTYIPLHEGVVRYLKEIGEWTESRDQRQSYNQRLVDWYAAAYQDAIEKAEAKGYMIHPSDEEWIQLWKDYKKEIEIPIFKIMSDDEVAAGLDTLPESPVLK